MGGKYCIEQHEFGVGAGGRGIEQGPAVNNILAAQEKQIAGRAAQGC